MRNVAEPALNAALAKAREARRQQMLRLRRDEGMRAETERTRRRGDEMLAAAFTKAGISRDHFQTLRTEHLQRLRHAADARKADLAEQSLTSTDLQRLAFETQRRAIEVSALRPLIAPIAPGQPYPFYVPIDVPASITATPGFNLQHWGTAPWNSWAKVGFSVSSDTSFAQEQLTFTFLWQNPNDVYSVINVDGYMTFAGTCEATANDGWFSPDTSDVSVSAELVPWQLWEQPPAGLGGDPNQSLDILPNVHTDGGTGLFGGVGDIELRNVHTGCDLRYDVMVVPPQATAAFDLSMTVNYDIAGGSVDVDFQTKNFQVMGIGVLVAIVS